MASSSYMKKQVDDDDKSRNWAELPSELTSSILSRLDTIDVLENAQKVCKPWRHVTKDPSMWRKIDMQNTTRGFGIYELNNMCRHAVDRSEGGLVEIKIRNFGNDQLLDYIAERSSNLRSLSLVKDYGVSMDNWVSMDNGVSEEGLVKAVAKFPFLEELEFSDISPKLDLKAIGHYCSRLTTLKLNRSGLWRMGSLVDRDDDALAVAESMPELRHLQLIGNGLSNIGLNAILDRCSHLEHLDLRKCFKVNLVGELKKRCFERIKALRCPNDSTDDFPFGYTLSDTDSDLDDYYDDYIDHDDLIYDYDMYDLW